jgi:hypothetical protein
MHREGGGGVHRGGGGGCTCILCIPPGYAPVVTHKLSRSVVGTFFWIENVTMPHVLMTRPFDSLKKVILSGMDGRRAP